MAKSQGMPNPAFQESGSSRPTVRDPSARMGMRTMLKVLERESRSIKRQMNALEGLVTETVACWETAALRNEQELRDNGWLRRTIEDVLQIEPDLISDMPEGECLGMWSAANSVPQCNVPAAVSEVLSHLDPSQRSRLMGLLAAVLFNRREQQKEEETRQHEHSRVAAARIPRPTPDLRTQPEAWFDRWSASRDGQLRFAQLLGGARASLAAAGVHVQAGMLGACLLRDVWNPAGLGESVSRDQFLEPGGVGYALYSCLSRVAPSLTAPGHGTGVPVRRGDASSSSGDFEGIRRVRRPGTLPSYECVD